MSGSFLSTLVRHHRRRRLDGDAHAKMDGRHGVKLEIGGFRSTRSQSKATGVGKTCGAGKKGDGVNDVEKLSEWRLGGVLSNAGVRRFRSAGFNLSAGGSDGLKVSKGL